MACLYPKYRQSFRNSVIILSGCYLLWINAGHVDNTTSSILYVLRSASNDESPHCIRSRAAPNT